MLLKEESVNKKASVTSANNCPNVKEYFTMQNFNFITQFLHSIRYGHLKKFLQKVLVEKPKPNIFEIGCGYGKTLSILTQNPKFRVENYLGIDIEPQFISYCQQKDFDPKYQFLFSDIRNFANGHKNIPFDPDVIIALECFEHINEFDIPRVIEWISSLNCPLFISVPNEIGPAILFKNIGSFLMGYIRHKEYSWMETLQAALYRLERVTPHSTGHIGFDYRWLAAVINQKFIITKVGTSPWNFIPRSFSPSIYFYCEPRTIK